MNELNLTPTETIIFFVIMLLLLAYQLIAPTMGHISSLQVNDITRKRYEMTTNKNFDLAKARAENFGK